MKIRPLKLLAISLPCLALSSCASVTEACVDGVIGALFDGDSDDDSDSSLGKRHVARQSSGGQPAGVR